jgi:SAM-dependent methyltransferase
VSDSVRDHFDVVAPGYDEWKRKAGYYYATLRRLLREVVPPGRKVLEVGCGTGDLLAALEPADGLGIDLSPAMVAIAQSKHPGLRFRAEDVTRPAGGERFDFVVLCDVIEHLPDVPAALVGLAAHGDRDTLYVNDSANPLWAPVLDTAERLGLKMPEGDHRWLSRRAIERLLREHGYVVERTAGRMLVPKRIPIVADALNGLAERVPALAPLCLVQLVTFRRAA